MGGIRVSGTRRYVEIIGPFELAYKGVRRLILPINKTDVSAIGCVTRAYVNSN